jgi:hypothetical protein
VSTILHGTLYMFLSNLLNVLAQTANKMELQKRSVWYLRLHLTFLHILCRILFCSLSPKTAYFNFRTVNNT